MEGGLPQLDPTWYVSQLFWLTVTFVIFYLMMARTIVPRVHEVLEARQTRISGDLDRAASLKSEAEAAKSHYEQALSGARAQSQQQVEAAMASIKSDAESRQQGLDADLKSQLEASDRSIAKAQADARTKLEPVAAELAKQIVQTIMHTAPDDARINAAVRNSEGSAV